MMVREFHIKLMGRLNKATPKSQVINIIDSMHDKYMKTKTNCL